MRTKLTIIYLFSVLCVFGQHKYDYQWPFGDGSNFDAGFGISMLDFNENVSEVVPYQEVDIFELDNSSSFICDENGQLMLMTNNCEIVDHNFNIIEGGEEITPGETYDNYCDSGDYPSDQCTLFLPEMSNDSTFYLVHKDSEVDGALEDVLSRKLYLSIIIKRFDGSFYVKEKQRLLLSEDLIWGRLTAVLSADDNRWWIWVLGYESNLYYKFLVGGEEVVQGPFIQNIGPSLKTIDLDVGQTAFSPNTQLLAINSETYGIILYDFDAQSGLLSNYRAIPYPNMDSAHGLVFSPNSRFIYVSSLEDLYQIDLMSPHPDSVVTHLGYMRVEDIYGWPTLAGQMYLGPDCRIYISPGTAARLMHVIHHPNRRGSACEVEVGGISPPARVEFDLPNLPMYRFNGQCDSTIAWGIISGVEEVIEEKEGEVYLFPNPATDLVTLSLPIGYDYRQVQLLNAQGQLLRTQAISKGQLQLEMITVDLPRGLYFLVVSGTENSILKLVLE